MLLTYIYIYMYILPNHIMYILPNHIYISPTYMYIFIYPHTCSFMCIPTFIFFMFPHMRLHFNVAKHMLFCAKHNAKTGWVVIFICIHVDVSINIYVVSCSMSCIMWLQRRAYTKYYAQCPAVINYYIIYIDHA